MAKTTSNQLLEEMIEILSKPDGWCQGELHKYEGEEVIQSCIIGAQVIAFQNHLSNGWEPSEAIGEYPTDRITRALEAINYLPDRGSLKPYIAQYNDDSNTTQEDIVLLVKRARYDY